MTIPTAREAQEQARARVLEQQDDLCKLSRALGVLASASVRKMSIWFSTINMQSRFTRSLFENLFVFDINSRYAESEKNSWDWSRKRYSVHQSISSCLKVDCVISILCPRLKTLCFCLCRWSSITQWSRGKM